MKFLARPTNQRRPQPPSETMTGVGSMEDVWIRAG